MSKNKIVPTLLLFLFSLPAYADPAGEMSTRLKNYPPELTMSAMNYIAVSYATGEKLPSGGIKPTPLHESLPIISRYLTNQIRQCYADADFYIPTPTINKATCANRDNANAAFIDKDATSANVKAEIILNPKTIKQNEKRTVIVKKYQKQAQAVHNIIKQYSNYIFVVLPLDIMQNQFRYELQMYTNPSDEEKWWSLPQIRHSFALNYFATLMFADSKKLSLQTLLTDTISKCYKEGENQNNVNLCAELDNSYATYNKYHSINKKTQQWNTRHSKRVALTQLEAKLAKDLLLKQKQENLIYKIAPIINEMEQNFDTINEKESKQDN